MINFLSLFSGIGAFEKALDRLGVEYNLVNYCEIDKYASKSYSAIHNVPESLNLGDITKVDTSKLPPIDMISYGFPCQDISLAGKQKGLFNEDGTQTRSGLFFEALRIIEDTKPKVAIAENVKNLVSKKFNAQFQIVLESLEQAGYNNYWQVLNAKDYGIPQNRERVFIVSIRKDIDNGAFKFPEPFELELRLKDLLEPEVDEKYYLSEKMIAGFTKHNENHEAKGTGFIWKPRDINGCASTLRANAALCPTDNTIQVEPERLGGIFDTEKSKRQAGAIWNKEKISPTLDTMQGGYRQPLVTVNESKIDVIGNLNKYPLDISNRVYSTEGISPTVNAHAGDTTPKITVKEATKQGYTEAYEGDSINFEQPNSKTRRGRVGKQVAQTLTTSPQIGAVTDNLRIRKLTPLECWRLMGFDDEDFYKAEKVCSNTQLYKQAGNSIVVDVLEYLFKEIMEVLDVKKVEDKVVVYECENLINLEALKEKEPELYEELLADYPCEKATYVFKVVS